MKLAVVIPYWLDRPALEALEIARNADRLGYEELWIGEMATFEAFGLAGAIARETQRVELTVGPLAAGVRTPVQLAMGWASVAELAARPVEIALGASTPVIVSAWHGRRWDGPVDRMRETVTALRRLAAGERTSFRGESWSIDGFRLRLPIARPRITVAAFGKRMLDLAARVADRVVVNLVTREQVASTRERLERAAAQAGRAVPPLCVWLPAAVDPSPATRAQLAQQLTAYLPAPGYAEMFAAAGFGGLVELARSGMSRRELADHVGVDVIGAVSACGTLEEVRARLREYQNAGADSIAVVPATAADPGGERTMTALRS
jgi:probable F420-dependent oxidoreductase